MINCKTELDLLWSKEYIMSKISITPRVAGIPNANPSVPDVQIIAATFQINNAKHYVPVATCL